MYIHLTNYGYDNKWLSFIQNILNSCGMSNIWIDQNGVILVCPLLITGINKHRGLCCFNN